MVWLRSLGLEQYAPAFRDNDIEAETLPQLTAEDLVALGVASVGHRRKLLSGIAALRAGSTPRDIASGNQGSGQLISPQSRVPPPNRSVSPRAERRQLTVMFIDLVGSTALSQRLDPEDMGKVIHAFQKTVSAEIARYDGKVAKLMGDGVLAYFGWPQAHEDDAERAVRAGIAAAKATALLAAPAGQPLAARTGIATGLVVIGDLVGEGSAQEEAVIGDTPNLAARLQALAEPNSVVIADGTQRLVAGLFDVVDLGHRDLKGFAEPVRAWCIGGETRTESRFEARHGVTTPLVGRAEELELLLQRWQQARAGGGQALLLSGEAGIGKSRLLAALDERLRAEPHAQLRYFCSPYHVNNALHPVITQLERAAGLDRNDSADTKLDKLENLLRGVDPGKADTIPLLATLLSIDTAHRYSPVKLTPLAQKARTLAILIHQIEALAARQPVMVLVEDAHWIDPTTSEWLDMLIDRLHNLPVFLIATFRPEFQAPWTRLSHATALSLGRLQRDQGAAIMERVAGSKALPPEVASQILAKTEGVPLFIEELTKTVLDSGLLVDAGDHYVLSGPLPSLAIPSTLQDSLMARLDRVAAAKEVAQIGACIGRVFHHRLIAAVTSLDDARLKGILRQLERSELVFRRGVPPEATYMFKHALVRDAAYESLLKSRRKNIHAGIGAALETEFQEFVEAEPGTLAHHFTAAGLPEQAAAYWLKAGQQALKRSANLEAAAHLRKGLELLGSLPDSESRLRQELSLQTAMGVALIATRGWGAQEILQAYSRAQTLSNKLGDKRQLFVAIRGESAYRMTSGDLRTADRLGRQCLELGLELAQTSGAGFVVEAHHQQWATSFFLADYDACEYHAKQGIAAYDPDRHHYLTYMYAGHDPGVCCRVFSASVLCVRGHADQALDGCRNAIALAERESHPGSMVQALHNFSFVHLMQREPVEGRRWGERGLALCKEFVMPVHAAQATILIGWALADLGHVEEGIERLREGIAAMASTGADMGMACYLGVLARACGEHGNPGEGLDLLEKAFDNLVKSDSKYHFPELLLTKGELLSRLDPNDDASESCFRQSLATARAQGTKLSELRAALHLARIHIGRGRETEARKLLIPIYGWFSKSYATPDLLEAKAILEKLGVLT
jgi:class 3 adenylate cyclase/predicted ATPase